jgi:hypothetical protein
MREFIHTPLAKFLELLIAGFMGFQVPSTLTWLFGTEPGNGAVLLLSIFVGFMAGVGIGRICNNIRAQYPLE